MADIFDVDNPEHYEALENENQEPDLSKLEQSAFDVPVNHAQDADDFYNMMSQQKWIPEQAKSDWNPFEDFQKTPEQVMDEVAKKIGADKLLKAGEILDKSGILSWGNLQEQINMNKYQLEMWGDDDKQHIEWRDRDGNIVDKHTDATNPAHYNKVPAHLQHWDVVDQMGWGYHLGCATKYIWRAGKKASAHLTIEQKEIEDLEKAVVYIQKRIELIKGDK